MPLVEEYSEVNLPERHFLYITKAGAFSETASACWAQFGPVIPVLRENHHGLGNAAMFNKELNQYFAGIFASAEPLSDLPGEVSHMTFTGGKYLQFTLQGPYHELPQAWGRVFEILKEKEVMVRDGLFLEEYGDSAIPEDERRTLLCVPI